MGYATHTGAFVVLVVNLHAPALLSPHKKAKQITVTQAELITIGPKPRAIIVSRAAALVPLVVFGASGAHSGLQPELIFGQIGVEYLGLCY